MKTLNRMLENLCNMVEIDGPYHLKCDSGVYVTLYAQKIAHTRARKLMKAGRLVDMIGKAEYYVPKDRANQLKLNMNMNDTIIVFRKVKMLESPPVRAFKLAENLRSRDADSVDYGTHGRAFRYLILIHGQGATWPCINILGAFIHSRLEKS